MLYINKTCSEILYDCKRILVTKIGFFTIDSGKFETEKYVVKYSKGDLFLYDKVSKELLNEYKFNCFKNITLTNGISGTPQDEPPQSDIEVSAFEVIKGYIVILYVKTDGTYYISNNGTIENVISKIGVGSDTLYTTDFGNVLSVGAVRTSKFNGIPIGRIR